MASISVQEELHSQLVRCTTKVAEDLFISTQMMYEHAKTKTVGAKKDRDNIWKYILRYDHAIDFIVCKTFLKKLFQVKIKVQPLS